MPSKAEGHMSTNALAIGAEAHSTIRDIYDLTVRGMPVRWQCVELGERLVNKQCFNPAKQTRAHGMTARSVLGGRAIYSPTSLMGG